MSSAQLAPGTAIETFTVSGIARSRVGATTYDATDASGAPVQVTVYDAACFPSALVLERSLRELRQLQTVAHPRVARVLGCGKLAGGGTWEAHAPLPPQSLAEHLAAGALAEADAIAIASQIGDALIEAQKVGVIHRSLGADVVFPSPNGVVVAGFAVGAPQGGKSFGPLDTIAPEQVEGKVVDQRTLIYNLAALLHGMLRGEPLFVGDVASILQAHLTQEPTAEIAPALRRGLAKDPRVRPMMLRQFVTEISQGVGAAATDSGAPTSRGWTMFTSDSPTPASATPAAAAAPASAEPSAPVPSPPPMADAAQPSTRGWTMFMQAADDDAAPASATAAASTPAAAPVAAATPAAVVPAVPAAGAKPSTRGWTMFMQATDDPDAATAAAAAASPNVVIATTAAAAPVAAAAPASAAPATAAVAPPAVTAPSSRGWTMFTNAADAEEPAPTASAAASPTPAPIDATVVAPPPTAGDAAKPSTRGWTMFTRDDEAPPPSPATAASASASAATPVEPVPDGADGGPPSSRGWTMFMEPGAAAAAAASAGAPPTSTSTSNASSSATPAATPVAEAEAPAGGQRRGWTMFMEAPITSAPQAQFGPTGVAPAEPTPEPPVDTSSSDNRGWTVFGAPAPGAAAPDAATAEGRTVAVTPTPVAHDASEGPTASGQVTSSEAPEPAPGRGRTVVAAGVPAVAGSVGGVTGRTVFPSATQPAMPDTQYFRRGDIPPERPTSRTTALDVNAPAGRPPVEERDASSRGPVPALGEPNIPEHVGGSKTALLVVVGVAVVGTIVVIVAYLT